MAKDISVEIQNSISKMPLGTLLSLYAVCTAYRGLIKASTNNIR